MIVEPQLGSRKQTTTTTTTKTTAHHQPHLHHAAACQISSGKAAQVGQNGIVFPASETPDARAAQHQSHSGAGRLDGPRECGGTLVVDYPDTKHLVDSHAVAPSANTTSSALSAPHRIPPGLARLFGLPGTGAGSQNGANGAHTLELNLVWFNVRHRSHRNSNSNSNNSGSVEWWPALVFASIHGAASRWMEQLWQTRYKTSTTDPTADDLDYWTLALLEESLRDLEDCESPMESMCPHCGNAARLPVAVLRDATRVEFRLVCVPNTAPLDDLVQDFATYTFTAMHHTRATLQSDPQALGHWKTAFASARTVSALLTQQRKRQQQQGNRPECTRLPGPAPALASVPVATKPQTDVAPPVSTKPSTTIYTTTTPPPAGLGETREESSCAATAHQTPVLAPPVATTAAAGKKSTGSPARPNRKERELTRAHKPPQHDARRSASSDAESHLAFYNSSQDDDDSELNDAQRVLNDAAYVPPLDANHMVEADDDWNMVWSKLEYAGWTRRRLGSNALFVKPAVRILQSQPGVGYFTSLMDVQAFCRKAYNWEGVDQRTGDAESVSPKEDSTDDEESSDESELEDMENRHVAAKSTDTVASNLTMPTTLQAYYTQTDVSPPRPSIASSTSPSVIASSQKSVNSFNTTGEASIATEDLPFNEMWKVLKDKGWHHKNGKGLVDYYYIRPGKSLDGGVLNEDFFTEPGLVMEFVKATKKAKGKRKKNDKEIQAGDNHTPPSKSTSSGPSKKAKKSLVNTASSPNAQSQHWWKRKRLPYFEEIWPSLEKLGYVRVAFSTCTVYEVPAEYTDDETVRFESITALRQFLCKYGIPGLEFGNLLEEEAFDLDRWVAFANVPVQPNESVEILRHIPVPKDDRLVRMLTCDLSFRVLDGMICLPSADQRKGRERTLHVDYFPPDDLSGKFRREVRALFTLPGEQAKMSKTKQETILNLRLWAAATSDPLPVFGWPKGDKRKVDQIKRDVELLKHQNDKYQDLFISRPDPSVSDSLANLEPKSVQVAKKSKRKVDTSSRSSSKRKARPVWYRDWSYIQSMDDKVLDVIFKLNFVRDPFTGEFSHPNIPGLVLPSLVDVRSLVARCGVPTYESTAKVARKRGPKTRNIASDCPKVALEPEEKKILRRWAATAFLPKDALTHDNYPKKWTEDKLREFVVALGFRTVDNKYWCPGYHEWLKVCPKEKNDDKKLKLYVSEFPTLVEVQDFIRSSERLDWREDDESNESKKRREQRFAIRIWSASSADELDLPHFELEGDRFLAWQKLRKLRQSGYHSSPAKSVSDRSTGSGYLSV